MGMVKEYVTNKKPEPEVKKEEPQKFFKPKKVVKTECPDHTSHVRHCINCEA